MSDLYTVEKTSRRSAFASIQAGNGPLAPASVRTRDPGLRRVVGCDQVWPVSDCRAVMALVRSRGA